ncbi:hypothetical protein Tco_1285917 [Tanacetum coccineum]
MFDDSDFDELDDINNMVDDAMENVEGDRSAEKEGSREKGGSTAEQITTDGDIVNTASIDISVASPSKSIAGDIFEDEMMTIDDTLVAIRSTRPRTTSVFMTLKKTKEEQHLRLLKDCLKKIKHNVQARMDADALLAARLQEKEREKFSIDEQARFLVGTIAERKRFFAAQRAEQIRNKPPTKTQLRNKMITYLKNIDPDDENVKRQKLEDAADKKGLKAYLKFVPDEDRAVNYETITTKYPIVDWESQIIGSDLQENDLSYWKITRANGSSKFYKVFSMMLEDFDRQDLVDLHTLVNERSASRALESWKLYETYGVHTLLMDGTLVCINMLVEQKYPLTQEMLTRMLNWRLEADFENEMAYELIRFVKSQV